MSCGPACPVNEPSEDLKCRSTLVLWNLHIHIVMQLRCLSLGAYITGLNSRNFFHKSQQKSIMLSWYLISFKQMREKIELTIGVNSVIWVWCLTWEDLIVEIIAGDKCWECDKGGTGTRAGTPGSPWWLHSSKCHCIQTNFLVLLFHRLSYKCIHVVKDVCKVAGSCEQCVVDSVGGHCRVMLLCGVEFTDEPSVPRDSCRTMSGAGEVWLLVVINGCDVGSAMSFDFVVSIFHFQKLKGWTWFWGATIL